MQILRVIISAAAFLSPGFAWSSPCERVILSRPSILRLEVSDARMVLNDPRGVKVFTGRADDAWTWMRLRDWLRRGRLGALDEVAIRHAVPVEGDLRSALGILEQAVATLQADGWVTADLIGVTTGLDLRLNRQLETFASKIRSRTPFAVWASQAYRVPQSLQPPVLHLWLGPKGTY